MVSAQMVARPPQYSSTNPRGNSAGSDGADLKPHYGPVGCYALDPTGSVGE